MSVSYTLLAPSDSSQETNDEDSQSFATFENPRKSTRTTTDRGESKYVTSMHIVRTYRDQYQRERENKTQSDFLPPIMKQSIKRIPSLLLLLPPSSSSFRFSFRFRFRSSCTFLRTSFVLDHLVLSDRCLRIIRICSIVRFRSVILIDLYKTRASQHMSREKWIEREAYESILVIWYISARSQFLCFRFSSIRLVERNRVIRSVVPSSYQSRLSALSKKRMGEEAENSLSRESSFGSCRNRFQDLLLREPFSNSEFNNSIPIFFRQVVFIHQFNHFRYRFLQNRPNRLINSCSQRDDRRGRTHGSTFL